MSQPDTSSTAPTRQRGVLGNLIVGVNAALSTMLGIGGGAVMVPLLILLMKFPIRRAIGTSLAVIVLVICVGLVAQIVQAPGDIHWDIALVLLPGSIVGSFIGKWLNRVIPEHILRYAFALVLAFVALRLFGALPHTEPLLGYRLDVQHFGPLLFLAITGLVAGVASALFGLGGGIVVVPALALGYGFFAENFTHTRATSLAMVLPTSLIGAVLHWRAGNVDRAMVMRTTPLALVAAVGGVLLAYQIDADTLKFLFAILMVLAGLRLALHRPPKAAKKT